MTWHYLVWLGQAWHYLVWLGHVMFGTVRRTAKAVSGRMR